MIRPTESYKDLERKHTCIRYDNWDEYYEMKREYNSSVQINYHLISNINIKNLPWL